MIGYSITMSLVTKVATASQLQNNRIQSAEKQFIFNKYEVNCHMRYNPRVAIVQVLFRSWYAVEMQCVNPNQLGETIKIST